MKTTFVMMETDTCACSHLDIEAKALPRQFLHSSGIHMMSIVKVGPSLDFSCCS